MKKPVWLEKAFCLTLSGLLLCFYLFTLYQGLHPRMSRGYRTFYLGHQVFYWPGEEGILIHRGEVMHFDSRTAAPGQIAGHFHKSDYEYGEEYEWRYTEQGYGIVGWKSDLIFETEPGEGYQCRMVFETTTPGGEISVFANGELVAHSALEPPEQEVVFEIPGSLTESGQLILEFILGGDCETPLMIREVVLW